VHKTRTFLSHFTKTNLKRKKYYEYVGRILGTRTSKDNKVIFDIEMEYEETLSLKGHRKDVHVFSEDAAEVQTNLSQRGTNVATKYFLIPRILRKNLDFNGKVYCQKIETSTKNIFVFVVDKIKAVPVVK
jgi:hypothetical protein